MGLMTGEAPLFDRGMKVLTSNDFFLFMATETDFILWTPKQCNIYGGVGVMALLTLPLNYWEMAIFGTKFLMTR